MKRITITQRLLLAFIFAFVGLGLASCVKETEDGWDPYYDWQARNEAWFAQIGDSAHREILAAMAAYGEAWYKHTDWRAYKSLLRSEQATGLPQGDSIYVHIRQYGTGTSSPLYNDTTKICFQGWLMPTKYEDVGGTFKMAQEMFTKTFDGAYDPATCMPQEMIVNQTVEGFCTALQYMVPGDVWDVYIPQQQAYGETATGHIPAYSTLLFRIYMIE